MGPPARLCQVCNEAQSKYKCPNCFTPYKLRALKLIEKNILGVIAGTNASVMLDSETPCAKPEPTEEKAIFPESPVERPLNVDEPSQVLQKEQLESIASSSEIRDALQDESLQKLILGIDSSSNPEIELDKAMEVEAFRTFTDKHSCRNLNAELLSSTLASFVFRFLLLSAPDSKQLFLHEAQYVMQKLTSQTGYGRQKLIILQKYFEAYLCRLPNHTIIRENRNCTCHFGWGNASQVLIFARQV
ncbi:hypothetical protein WN944_016589 [Citrus x changshan-huyou]|uniref:HIT-type domain-containing protein n=1 Tax=Citrus x changshan-huyou TaxID=2935761 RepID=A0AAP0MBX6_9ROSI